MEALFALIVFYLIGTAISRFYRALVGSSSPSSQNEQDQKNAQQRNGSNKNSSVTLKDLYATTNSTRRSFAGRSSTASSQKRNQQSQSKQLSHRMQQEATRKKAEHLQQNNKRRPEEVRSSASSKTSLFRETTQKQTVDHTLFEKNDLTTLTPIDKVSSAKKTSRQSATNQTRFQNDYVKGIIFKEILDKPVSLRNK